MSTATLPASVRGKILACARCKLADTARRPVPGEGSVPADVLFIGEAPGQDEDRMGRPFIGRAGEVLREYIRDLKISSYFITNTVLCRPPGNRVPEQDEIEACSPHLKIQMALVDPQLIVPLGGTALSVFHSDHRISRVNGRTLWWEGVKVIPVFHPSYTLRPGEDQDERLDEFTRAMVKVAQEADRIRRFLDGTMGRWEFRQSHMLIHLEAGPQSPYAGKTVAFCSTDEEGEIAYRQGWVPLVEHDWDRLMGISEDPSSILYGSVAAYGGGLED